MTTDAVCDAAEVRPTAGLKKQNKRDVLIRRQKPAGTCEHFCQGRRIVYLLIDFFFAIFEVAW